MNTRVRFILLFFIFPFYIFSQDEIYTDYDLEIAIQGVRNQTPIDSIFITITNIQTTRTDTFLSKTYEKLNVFLDSNSDYRIFAKFLKKVDIYSTFKTIISTKKKEKPATIFSTIMIERFLRPELYKMENVYYDNSSYTIDSIAAIELDKLVEILTKFNTLEVEFTSYIDCNEKDKSLVARRNQAVYNYIVNAGIERRRLRVNIPTGDDIYFCKKKNCTIEQQKINRKTEFKVLKF